MSNETEKKPETESVKSFLFGICVLVIFTLISVANCAGLNSHYHKIKQLEIQVETILRMENRS